MAVEPDLTCATPLSACGHFSNLIAMAKHFIAGLLRHAPELTLVTNQWVNSYKRLVHGFEAPVYISWASVNRSDLIRIPAYKVGRQDSVRIEYRAPDPACNPYLAFAALLSAGMTGIKNQYPLPEPAESNVFTMTSQERQEKNIGLLPGTLLEATRLAETSGVLREALGDHVLDTLLTNKRIEWEQYRTTVTDYELKRYLPMI